jgi:L-lactate dehydrogenase complex protein LldF
MQGMAWVLSHPKIYRLAGAMGRFVVKNLPFLVNNGLNPWAKQREMPEAPKESFQSWYQSRKS